MIPWLPAQWINSHRLPNTLNQCLTFTASYLHLWVKPQSLHDTIFIKTPRDRAATEPNRILTNSNRTQTLIVKLEHVCITKSKQNTVRVRFVRCSRTVREHGRVCERTQSCSLAKLFELDQVREHAHVCEHIWITNLFTNILSKSWTWSWTYLNHK